MPLVTRDLTDIERNVLMRSLRLELRRLQKPPATKDSDNAVQRATVSRLLGELGAGSGCYVPPPTESPDARHLRRSGAGFGYSGAGCV